MCFVGILSRYLFLLLDLCTYSMAIQLPLSMYYSVTLLLCVMCVQSFSERLQAAWVRLQMSVNCFMDSSTDKKGGSPNGIKQVLAAHTCNTGGLTGEGGGGGLAEL